MGAGVGYYHVPLDDGPSADPSTGSLFLDAVRFGETAVYQCFWYDVLYASRFASSDPAHSAPSGQLAWSLGDETGYRAGSSASGITEEGFLGQDEAGVTFPDFISGGFVRPPPYAPLVPGGFSVTCDDTATADAFIAYHADGNAFAADSDVYPYLPRSTAYYSEAGIQSGTCTFRVSGMDTGGIQFVRAARYVRYTLLNPDGSTHAVFGGVRRYVPIGPAGAHDAAGVDYAPWHSAGQAPAGSALAPNGTDWPNPSLLAGTAGLSDGSGRRVPILAYAGKSPSHRFVVGFTWSASVAAAAFPFRGRTLHYPRLTIDISPKAGGKGESYDYAAVGGGVITGQGAAWNGGFNFSASPIAWTAGALQSSALDLTDKCCFWGPVPPDAALPGYYSPPTEGATVAEFAYVNLGTVLAADSVTGDITVGIGQDGTHDVRSPAGPNTTLFTGHAYQPPYSGRFGAGVPASFPQTVTVRLRPVARADTVYSAGSAQPVSLRPIWLWGPYVDVLVPLNGGVGGGGSGPTKPARGKAGDNQDIAHDRTAGQVTLVRSARGGLRSEQWEGWAALSLPPTRADAPVRDASGAPVSGQYPSLITVGRQGRHSLCYQDAAGRIVRADSYDGLESLA